MKLPSCLKRNKILGISLPTFISGSFLLFLVTLSINVSENLNSLWLLGQTDLFYQINSTIDKIKLSLQPKQIAIGFWGDVMLARNVELLSDIHGTNYSFTKITNQFLANNYNIINFEGTISNKHSRTLSNTMSFSVTDKLVPELASVNITHASLANNHALDFGPIALKNTTQKLLASNIIAFGNPNEINNDSVVYIDLGSYRLSVLALHTLYSTPLDEDLIKIFKKLNETSDIQFVYIHWGEEYKSAHTEKQFALAQKLIVLGADAIIGHHPHVVEDIGLIDGVPVFYSLGNTIFDQYFSLAVQSGYSVNFFIRQQNLEFTLFPFTSIDNHSQPRPMKKGEQDRFLEELASKSNLSLRENIKQAKLIFPFELASSS
ncbi:hypothetical protein A2592_02230 [Candidatus Kaiserbacteria bacterium RIFOXYD1_FULL_42_15]|uniref:Capsule synthesis protein CapA domain-containing protein n=1 Tax=Candidatus Kaiserbacteria bacterium RIFOXYD1_FULL_42_15 TaxID=1798532 RepID=A0A1F6FT77_9BACT|nr:MAG: hypothetical protein A2592_02230 [Candidatus Kaiserbacteria bacterium RIFOXYD1_FULL_42_15]